MKTAFPRRAGLAALTLWLALCMIGVFASLGKAKPAYEKLQDGDLIFQESNSPQSLAIKLATKSQYSHCGIIFKEGSEYYVSEAVQPVQTIPLKEWIERGVQQRYVVKRLKNADTVLTPAIIAEMKRIARSFEGAPYDIYFEWSDTAMYCSEFVWKIYNRAAGIEITPLRKMKEFNLNNPLVKFELIKRYGQDIPYEQLAVAPSDILHSPLLETVEE